MMLMFILTLTTLLAGLLIGFRITCQRQQAFRNNLKEVSIFGDFMQVITWEPNEGVVMMRNNEIQPVQFKRGQRKTRAGGARLISPWLGQLVYARLPLSRNKTVFELKNLLSFETIQLEFRVSLDWQVEDLDQFVEHHSPGPMRNPRQRGQAMIDRAEALLKDKTERILRDLVAQQSVSIPALAKMDWSLEKPDTQLTNIRLRVQHDAREKLKIDDQLHHELELMTVEHGIRILDRVLVELRLPAEIAAAIEKVWKSSLLPATSAHQALAREIEIRSLANLIGVDFAAINELLKNFRGASFLGPLPILELIGNKHPAKSNNQVVNGVGIRIRQKGFRDQHPI